MPTCRRPSASSPHRCFPLLRFPLPSCQICIESCLIWWLTTLQGPPSPKCHSPWLSPRRGARGTAAAAAAASPANGAAGDGGDGVGDAAAAGGGGAGGPYDFGAPYPSSPGAVMRAAGEQLGCAPRGAQLRHLSRDLSKTLGAVVAEPERADE
jgi:hypothetical protein